MSTISCPNCGHPNAETARFCAKCGNRLLAAETVVMGSSDLGTTGDRRPATGDPPPAASLQPTPVVSPRPAAPSQPPAPAAALSKEQAAYAPSPYVPPVYPAAAAEPAPTAPGQTGHRYVALRTIAGLCNILAIVSVVLSILGGLAAAVGGRAFGALGPVELLALLVFTAISAVVGWVFWRLLGEGIWLALDIESNTRRAAAALEQRRDA